MAREEQVKQWFDIAEQDVLIESFFMEEEDPSPLFDDVMRTGIAV